MNDQTWFEDNHMGNHRIVDRISVFGNIKIFLDNTAHIGEKRPVSADAAAIFIRLRDVVGADRDEPAIGNLEFTMKLDQPFSLSTVLWAEPSTTEYEDHWMWSL